jgi:hypothetical protein
MCLACWMVLMNIRAISLFEIFLIVLSGVAFSYIIGETNFSEGLPVPNKESKFISFVREKILSYLSSGIVSAQSVSVQTCLVDKSGASCQEYPSDICNSKCTSSCFPGRRGDFSSCKLGTCYDSALGLCNAGTPKTSCENQNGTWSADTPVQCNRRCCLINPDNSGGASQAKITTNQECNYLSKTLGAPVKWDSQIADEIQCISKVKTQREGACVLELLPEINKYNCQFTTETKCLTKGGKFYVDRLCTNPQLNTKCEMTSNTKCFENKDAVYFIDSCGNRANVYDSSKSDSVHYWSSVVSFTQLCSINSGNNNLANQQSCGNCNYLRGNICGTPKPSFDKQPIIGQYVCKDLSCIDREGKKRQHGSSWCVFDSWTGLDGANGTSEERAVDVPGSRQFKELCFEGEIRLQPSAEYRNGLCVEGDVDDKGFTTASSRTNKGVLCTKNNEDAEKLAKCEENSDCYLKHVEVDKFKFDVCVPKYPPGFELSDKPQEDSVAICAAASQTCTYYEKKGIDFQWHCKINCACRETRFTETMNNLCISLGDCGSHVNLAGKLGDGYSIKGDKYSKLSDAYIQGLKKYIKPKPGQRVSGMTREEIEGLFGKGFRFDDPGNLAMILTSFGLGVAGAVALGAFGALSTTSWSLATLLANPFSLGFATTPTVLGSFSSAISGVAIGAGIGYIVGLGFDLEGDELYIAMAVGAVVGGVIGFYWTTILGWIGLAGSAGLIGWIVAAVVAVAIAILTVAGVGKYRERKVEFKCLPWQPPSGGSDCSKCNELGVAGQCTAYKCKSLGKTCELLNPNTADEMCVNIAPNDASAPSIGFNKTSLPQGFSYEEFNNGVKIKSSASDGCLQEYSPIVFDILANEPAQCKISSVKPDKGYDEMDDTFFTSSVNNYVVNHIESTAMPTLDSLGVSGVDPERRGQHNLYVLCKDKSGNSGDNAYNVRFCVSPANDVQSPIIKKFVPESPGVVGLNSSYFNLMFFTDEPSTCRFSSTDQAYETMENEANCQNGISQSTIDGWLCIARLNVTKDISEINYYFRCADQPWLGVDIQQNSITLEPGRNVMTQSTTYVVKKTTTPLTISSVTPNGKTILSASEPVPVTLDVVTNGGIDNGKAFCKYSLGSGDNYIDFAITSLNNHKQIFTSLFAGDYNIKLKCVDRAGNIAEGNSQFKIEVDNVGPLMTRVYNSGTNLKVVTNENSICEYSTNSCSFEFGKGTALSGAGIVHTMSYSNGLNYNIKCRDDFGNVGNCLSVKGGY